jgi:hypothetical protein
MTRPTHPFTEAQWLALVRALHSDSTNDENRNAAFSMLMEMEHVLRPPKARPISSAMPRRTLADLLARKYAVDEMRRKARAAKKAARTAARATPQGNVAPLALAVAL